MGAQEFVVDILPINGKKGVIHHRFTAVGTLHAVMELNKILNDFQIDKKNLNPKYKIPGADSYHPELGHDVTMEPFIHLKKYHRHEDGVVYITYKEFEPSYGVYPRQEMSPIMLARR